MPGKIDFISNLGSVRGFSAKGLVKDSLQSSVQSFATPSAASVPVGAHSLSRSNQSGLSFSQRACTVRAVSLLLVALFLASCDWVDSTGVQRSSDARVVTLQQGIVNDLIESEPLLLDPTETVDPTGEVRSWRWSNQPIESGNIPSCRASNGFSEEFAEDNLSLACTRAADCQMNFEQSEIIEDDIPRTVFQLTPPVLRAPVGVTYQLFANRDDGSQTIHDFTFCLIAINEAPVAADDSFTLVDGEIIERNSDGANLLRNDSDDIDTSNQPLAVSTEIFQAPRFADEFELFDDGTFRYVPRAGRLGTDSFIYQISDGRTSPSQATVSIIVTSANSDPVFDGPIPEFPLVAGLPVLFSFADFFSDPEGSQLEFTAAGLPSGLELTSSGELQGVPDAGSPGDYVITVTASDGRAVLETELELTVAGNQRIQVDVIPEQSIVVGESFSLNTAPFFSDPEEQPLVYTLSRPSDVALGIDRNTGEIAGVPAVVGSFLLQVTASDGITQPVLQTIVLNVEGLPNNSPSFSGTITDQTIELGERIAPIRPQFSDLDDDTLTYVLLGAVPEGVSINVNTGVVSGVPQEEGEFAGLAVRAEDPDGLRAVSNRFTITVELPVQVNRAPVYTGAIPNQEFTVGEEIEPFGGTFTDADGDTLDYSIAGGTLPAGLSISSDGVIIGTPLRAGTVTGLRIVATDAEDATARSDLFAITVDAAVVAPANTPPVFTPILDRVVEIDEEIEFFVIATDADSDDLTYELSGTAANFLSIDEDTGLIEGEFDRAGEFQAIVTVSDGDAETSISFSFTVDEETTASGGPNQDPVVTDIPNQVVTGSFSYDVSFVFDDPDGDELTFTAVNLPPRVDIDENGVITGVASNANDGTHFIVVTADDGNGGTVSDGFRLIINN